MGRDKGLQSKTSRMLGAQYKVVVRREATYLPWRGRCRYAFESDVVWGGSRLLRAEFLLEDGLARPGASKGRKARGEEHGDADSVLRSKSVLRRARNDEIRET